MLLWIAKLLEVHYTAFHAFSYLTLRAILTVMSALTMSLLVGPSMIERLSRYQIGQVVRDDGPRSHLPKAGTPTMGGALIIVVIAVCTLLWADLRNRFVWITLGVTVGFGLIGFYDDYLKLVVRSSRGLIPRKKYFYQSVIGVGAAVMLYQTAHAPAETDFFVPFIKSVSVPMGAFGFCLLAYLMIVGMSNAVNLTDGLDGLAITPAAMVAGALGIFAYASGNAIFANYLAIPAIPQSGELLIFCSALAGAGLGFLWFNSYPAQVFMGDIGALALGAALGVVATVVRQEIVALLMGGIFVLETASVILQVASFKLTGRRIFRMAPIHHHFELKGWAEPKVIVRFWIISFLLVLAGSVDPEAAMSESLSMPLRAVVVGIGKSGYSAVRYLRARGSEVAATDSRAEPPELKRVRALGDDIVVRTGGFDATLLEKADLVVVSPGVAMSGPFFDVARARSLPMIGDIELFARAVRAPVAAITGTNGKSTVTTLLAQMATKSGLRIAAGGNLGSPALDLLDGSVQLYILELSSFQLETTQSLSLAAATVLNVTPDHMDRYPDVRTYAAAKARIFERCEVAVINLDDPLVAAMANSTQRTLGFSLRADVGADFALRRGDDGDWWLTRAGQPLLALAQMRINGLHNAANALAALALGEALGLPRAACVQALREFAGLPHRAQWVGEIGGVRYINDSKGTNVGATLAAVAGMSGPLIVIAGGDGKGQDFSPLRAAFADKVRAVVLIGRAARALATVLDGTVACHSASTLDEAVDIAAHLAQAGDTVLLSPACASLDMFRDYAHRGSVFVAAVQRRSA